MTRSPATNEGEEKVGIMRGDDTQTGGENKKQEAQKNEGEGSMAIGDSVKREALGFGEEARVEANESCKREKGGTDWRLTEA